MINDEFDKEITEFFQKNDYVPQYFIKAIYDVNLSPEGAIYKKKNVILTVKKVAISIISLITISAGVVFAKDIENYIKSLFTNSTKSIDEAVQNGYVQTNEMEYVYDNNIGLKVDNLIFDEQNLDISFCFEIEKENVKSVRFKDFSITNENDKTVFSSELKYAETLDELPLYNSLTWNNEPIKVTNTTFKDSILLGLKSDIEEFRELYFDVKSVQLTYEDDTQEVIDGSWNFNVTISDEMITSSTIEYTYKEENEYIESCMGTLSVTGLSVNLTLKSEFDPMKYVEENIETINGIGFFYLKYNEQLVEPSNIEVANVEHTQYKFKYDCVGIFSEKIDEFEIYLEPFDTTIILKENN